MYLREDFFLTFNVRDSCNSQPLNPTVGDNPEGPLKQMGKSRLKPAKKTKPNASCLSAHTGHGPRRGGPRGPPWRPTQGSPRAGFASLEGARLPRAGSASLEGARLPRASSASLEGAPHAHARSRARERAFNALTTVGRRHHAPGTHAPALLHQLPRGNPSPPLWGTVRHGRCQPRDAAPPTPVRLTCRALEGGGGHTLEMLSRDLAGPGYDARPAGRHPYHC
jgi:hypothetical protein